MQLSICSSCGYPKRDANDSSHLYCSRCGALDKFIDISDAPAEALTKSVEFLWRTLLTLQERVEPLYLTVETIT